MAKYYLEINEILSMEKMAQGIQPVQVRVEVIDKADALSKLPSLEPFFVGRAYTKSFHICNHDTGGSCIGEEIL